MMLYFNIYSKKFYITFLLLFCEYKERTNTT